MATTQLPPDDQPPAPAPRRVNRGLLWAAALATVVLAVATVMAFVSDGDTADGIVKLDPNGTEPIGSLDGSSNPTGQALPALVYTTFAGGTSPLRPDGRPLVVNFWAASCGPCVQEMPAIQQFAETNAGRVDVLGLQVAEAADAGARMIERTGVTYPVGRDANGSIARALGGLNLPQTLVVGADGTIVAWHVGALSEADLQALVDDNTGS